MPISTHWKSIEDDVLVYLYRDMEVPSEFLENVFQHHHRTIEKHLDFLGIRRTRSEVRRSAWKNGDIEKSLLHLKEISFKKGVQHNNWKGGKCFDSHGYILIFDPSNPLSNNKRYVLEHRKIWFEHHPETPIDWVVHHLNGIRTDNRLENLFACPRESHLKKFPSTYVRALQARIKELESEQISN